MSLGITIPRRILMTADCVGGVWTYALELARALAPTGVEVALATMGCSLALHQRKEVAACTNLMLFESQYKLEWMDDPWTDVAEAGDWLLALEERLKPDIIHLNSYAHGTLPWRAPKIVVGHSCVLSWWRAVHGAEAPPEWNRYREHIRAGLQTADLVIAPSHAMLRCLLEHYGPFRATRVIPNARSSPPSLRTARKPFILTAGRLWDPAKNIAALSAIAPELPWPIYVAGQDTDPEGQQKSPAHLQALGKLPARELWSWMAQASIYALPARYEPFGLSALEAALAGCPLVLGDVPSLREIWGDAAVFVPPDQPAVLKEALVELIRDEARRSHLAIKASTVARRYAPDRMAARYLAAYRLLTQRGLAQGGLLEPDFADAEAAEVAAANAKIAA